MMQSRTWKNIENSAVEKIKAYFLENGGEEKEAWMEKINLLRKTNEDFEKTPKTSENVTKVYREPV